MNFGDKLREKRIANGYTQKELANRLGISVSCYAGYEQGYREPDFKTLVKICKELKVKSDYLLGID